MSYERECYTTPAPGPGHSSLHSPTIPSPHTQPPVPITQHTRSTTPPEPPPNHHTMNILNTSATLKSSSLLPPGASKALVDSLLRNHDLLIRLDPELSTYVELPTLENAPHAKLYKVTDIMHALPRGLWDSTVSFEAQMSNPAEGCLEWIIRAPLGLVQTSIWSVREGDEVGVREGGGERLWLVEEVEIKGSRLIVGTVKAKCEANWEGVHGRFKGHLEDAMRKESSA
ncbi:hypothetical protein EJ05DRAFT_483126 [Pseudovirgaria hyperparasitica]|uniref:DUF7053 domain-containing protein n=1 Tax=Pseudovirgaria hyperparasitica TaxID=470096 RepID=A0A6A6WJ27_9PEZI|nr:uncharacterized protein EJ05DRAFT_483126 [Pseudovirgaria hyperparasitica]KAF2762379.1 hypothetical protein EJ05DRAFT_483126 [Pseudovirgaria hyperparasitica]